MEENSEDNTVLVITLLTYVVLQKSLYLNLTEAPHGEYPKIQKDENRDKYLKSLGFNILRFENKFVFQEPEYLIDEIRKFINKKKNRSEKRINHPGRKQIVQ